MNKKKATIYTMASSILSTALIAFLGLFYSQKIMEVYGSQTNGLIATLTQFVSLFALIEGGFTTAATVALYRPVALQDKAGIEDVIYTTKVRFRILGLTIFLLAVGSGTIYLRYIESVLPYSQTFALLLVTASVTAGSLAFQSAYGIIYDGYNAQHYRTILSLIAKVFTWVLTMVLIFRHSNIVLVYLINVSNNFLIVFLFARDTKKRFSLSPRAGSYKPELIKGTNDVFIQKIASMVFNSTDLVLISAGVGLAQASVYTVYRQVFSTVNGVLTSFTLAPFNSFGHLYNEGDKTRFRDAYIVYQKTVLLLSTTVLGAVAIASVNFIRLYTARVSDINYITPMIPLLFFAQFYLEYNNMPLGMVLNVSKHFREQNLQCGLSAFANLLFSMIFMRLWGVPGIIMGSIIGMGIIYVVDQYRCYQFQLAVRKGCFGEVVANFILSVGVILFCLYFLPFAPTSYLGWFFLSALEFVIWAAIVCLFNLMISPQITKAALRKVFQSLEILKAKFKSN